MQKDITILEIHVLYAISYNERRALSKQSKQDHQQQAHRGYEHSIGNPPKLFPKRPIALSIAGWPGCEKTGGDRIP